MDSFESRMNPKFLAESEKGMMWEPRLIESGRETVGVTKREREELFCRRSVWADFPSSMFLCHLCGHEVLWWGWSLHWEERIAGAVCRKADGLQSGYYSYDIGERCSVQDEENWPQYWDLVYIVHELWRWRRRVIDWSGLLSVWEVWLKPLECSWLNTKNRVQAGKENLVVSIVKSCKTNPTKEEQKCCHYPEQREYRLQYLTKLSRYCVLLDRLTGRGCWSCSLGDRREVCGEWPFQGFLTEMEG